MHLTTIMNLNSGIIIQKFKVKRKKLQKKTLRKKSILLVITDRTIFRSTLVKVQTKIIKCCHWEKLIPFLLSLPLVVVTVHFKLILFLIWIVFLNELYVECWMVGWPKNFALQTWTRDTQLHIRYDEWKIIV